jgi:3-isopropylmalate/(R)-2-methylmalate dehydratase small subunit
MLTANPQQSRTVVEGAAVVLRGDDIDTDRIIPARFAKVPSFDALGEGVFADDRADAARRGARHPFDDPSQGNASIMFVNKNFGCGSSREHAVAALMRWRSGIRGLVGESFAEIFLSNCVANGVPAVTAGSRDVEALMGVCEREPSTRFQLDLRSMTITGGGLAIAVTAPAGARASLIDGSWDTLTGLLAKEPAIKALAATLPYLHGFAGEPTTVKGDRHAGSPGLRPDRL